MATLGFILTRSPFTEPHAATLSRLAAAAIARGHRVRAFLDLDGVAARLDPAIETVTCRRCAEARGLPGDADLSDFVASCDRVVTF
jgi:sulfur relay (sulfurtransferase) complex TusBCD TusD component (DsrE family)